MPDLCDGLARARLLSLVQSYSATRGLYCSIARAAGGRPRPALALGLALRLYSVICMVLWCLHSTSTTAPQWPTTTVRPAPWPLAEPDPGCHALPAPLDLALASASHAFPLTHLWPDDGTVPGVRPCPSMRYWSATVALVVCLSLAALDACYGPTPRFCCTGRLAATPISISMHGSRRPVAHVHRTATQYQHRPGVCGVVWWGQYRQGRS